MHTGLIDQLVADWLGPAPPQPATVCFADFGATGVTVQGNTGTQAAPTWTAINSGGTAGANEVRWSDSGTQTATASASWPAMIRPAAVGAVGFTYLFTTDIAGNGVPGGATPVTFANANYNMFRLNWDASGTFASAPIITAYPTTAHAAITRGDASLLGGQATDTGATARSYLKANAYGTGASQVPAVAPTNAPAATDGATGALVPATAAWLVNYQGLQGDNDYIQATATPAATTANFWQFMMALFSGPNLNPATYTVVLSMKYTWT